MPVVKKEWNQDEGNSSKMLPEGSYNFEVVTAELSTSASGNEMITVRLKVFDGQGSHVSIFDRLVFVDAAGWKIAQFCKAIGREDLVGAELNVTDCLAAAGELYLKQEHSEQYGNRNTVNGYNEPAQELAAAKAVKPPKKSTVATGNEIPF